MEIDLLLVYWPKTTSFSMIIKIDLVLVWVVQIHLISVRGIKFDLVSVWGSIWFGCCVSGWNWVGFWAQGEKSLAFSASMQLDLHFRGWSKLTWSQYEGSSLTWFQCRMKWIWLLCALSKMTPFWCSGSPLICFCVTVENYSFSASGSKITGFLCRGIEIDMRIAWGS